MHATAVIGGGARGGHVDLHVKNANSHISIGERAALLITQRDRTECRVPAAEKVAGYSTSVFAHQVLLSAFFFFFLTNRYIHAHSTAQRSTHPQNGSRKHAVVHRSIFFLCSFSCSRRSFYFSVVSPPGIWWCLHGQNMAGDQLKKLRLVHFTYVGGCCFMLRSRYDEARKMTHSSHSSRSCRVRVHLAGRPGGLRSS